MFRRLLTKILANLTKRSSFLGLETETPSGQKITLLHMDLYEESYQQLQTCNLRFVNHR